MEENKVVSTTKDNKLKRVPDSQVLTTRNVIPKNRPADKTDLEKAKKKFRLINKKKDEPEQPIEETEPEVKEEKKSFFGG